MAKMTFKALAMKVLEVADQPLNYKEIWDTAQSLGLADQLGSKGLTPLATLRRDLSQDVKSDSSKIGVIYGNPGEAWRYFLKGKPEQAKAPVKNASSPKPAVGKTASYLESQLHPFVAYFFRTQMNVACRTILHHGSTKSKDAKNVWLHADMMGVSLPHDDLPNVFGLARSTHAQTAQLYSIEIKRSVTASSLHENLFQAVSNSTWANEAYLVAADFPETVEFLEELQMLSQSFGVGIVRLNLSDPDASIVIAPARRREQVDWNRLERIASVSDSVRKFVEFASMTAEKKQHEDTLAAWFDPIQSATYLTASVLEKGD